MHMQLVRHATLRVEIAGRTLLIDPMLSEAGANPPIPYSPNDRRNPLTPLPVPVADVLRGVDAVLVTHLHRDHFDEAAAALLPKDLPLFCQPGDVERLTQYGFTQVLSVEQAIDFDGIEIVRTDGKHGVGLWGMRMGQVSGFVLRALGEPSLYIAGDTVWCGHVREALETFRPQVVVVNAGAAQFVTGTPITMDAQDIAQVCAAAPAARVVAVHMDAINHCLLTRDGLRAELAQRGLQDRVAIPADLEVLHCPER